LLLEGEFFRRPALYVLEESLLLDVLRIGGIDDMFLAAAYAQAGQLDKARETVARLRQAKPDITIELLRRRRYSNHPDYRRFEEDELFAGLRKAGIPEK
jgi:hypothetical protein